MSYEPTLRAIAARHNPKKRRKRRPLEAHRPFGSSPGPTADEHRGFVRKGKTTRDNMGRYYPAYGRHKKVSA